MVRPLSEAEKKKYAAMTAQANKLITAQKNGTYNPPKTTGVQTAGGSTLPASMTQNNNGVITPKPIVNQPPIAPAAPVVTQGNTNKSGGRGSRSSGNNRAGGGASVKVGPIQQGFDPIGAGIKKLDNATGIVSKISNSKGFQDAKLNAARGVVAAANTVRGLNDGYKSQANSPMRQAQNALKDTYLGATGKVDNQKAAQTAKAFTDKYISDPYKKSGAGQTLGKLSGVTRGVVDLATPVYSADSLGRGTGGALEAFDVGASAIPLAGGAVGFAAKVARKAEDFVKLADKAVYIAEVAAKSSKVADAIKAAPTSATLPTKGRSFTVQGLEGMLDAGGKVARRSDNGGLLVEVPKGKAGAGVYNASLTDVEKYTPAEVAKLTADPKKPTDIPAEEKIDTRGFKPGTFKGTAEDLTANVKTIYPVKGAKQTNMTQAQKDMLVADRTAARKEAGIKTNTPESKEFNKAFDEKWYAQKELSPNGGKAKTGDYELTLKDGSKHLVNEKDFPGLDLGALGTSLKGTAGKAADEVRAPKPPAGGPALIKHWVDKVTSEGKTTTTLRNALRKHVDEFTADQTAKVKAGSITQEQMDKAVAGLQKQVDDAIKGFNDAKAPQGPPAPTRKLSKSVKAEAEKAQSFYFNRKNDVTFKKVDGSTSTIKAKDMTPEDIVLLKKQLEEMRAGAKAADKPENLTKAGTVGKKGQYIPTPEEKLAMDKARVAARQAEEARTGVKFVKKSPEIKEFNKNFDAEYMKKNFGDRVPEAAPAAKAADKPPYDEFISPNTKHEVPIPDELMDGKTPDAVLTKYVDDLIDRYAEILENSSDGSMDILEALDNELFDSWDKVSQKVYMTGGGTEAQKQVDDTFDKIADVLHERLVAKGWYTEFDDVAKVDNTPKPLAPQEDVAKDYLSGQDISTPSSKVDPTAPTTKASPEVEAVTVPPAKGGSAKAAKVIHKGKIPQEDWDATILKQAQGATKIENAKVSGTKKAGWRFINQDGIKEGPFAKNELSPEVNAQIESLYGKAPATAKAADGVEAIAKSDAVPEAITPVKAEEPTLTQPTVGLKAVDDPVEQVAKQVSDLKKAKAADEGTQMSMDLGSTAAKTADEVPAGYTTTTGPDGQIGMDFGTTGAKATQGVDVSGVDYPKMDDGAADFGEQMTMDFSPSARTADPNGSNVNPPDGGGGGNVNSNVNAPKSWGKKVKVGLGVGAVGGIGYWGFKAGATGAPGATEEAPTDQSVADYYGVDAGAEDPGYTGGGYTGGGYGGYGGQMPQTTMPQMDAGMGQAPMDLSGKIDMGDGRIGYKADWYMIDENGQLQGPFEGVIGPDNLTYHLTERGQWERVPDGAIVDAPNGTDYQRGAGLDDDDPTNDHIYDPNNPYIPPLREVIDEELDEIIEENGGYTVENLMEVYAPYIEMQNAEIDAAVEQEIVALREQLAARGMYNSDIALTLEQQIRAKGESQKQEIYMQMFQQAQELAMEYGYKYAQLGEERRMNDYEIESGDREFQQAVKEFEAETGIEWAKLDLATQKEMFDRFNDDRKYNLSVYKANNSGGSGGSGGGGSATPATLVKIQNEMLDILNTGTQENPKQYVANKLKTYVSMGYLSDSQARQVAANLGML